MYSGNETMSAIRKLNSRGYSVTIENQDEMQVVILVFKGERCGVFRDEVFGRSSDSVPIYGTGMKKMIDWFYDNEDKL